MEEKGKFYKIKDTQVISEKFKKREFVLEVSNNPAYVQKVLFQLTQDKVDMIEGFNEGDEVKVYFNLQGKEWTSPKGEVKFFNTLDVWKLESLNETGGSNNNSTHNDEELTTKVDLNSPVEDDDDLPF